VVWGKYDRFISVKLAYEITEKLPNARLEVIDKSGHYVHMDKPQELAQVVTEFLREEAEHWPLPRESQKTAVHVFH
jgi:pimeloyl-ACP methyl ester carboxylesterase